MFSPITLLFTSLLAGLVAAQNGTPNPSIPNFNVQAANVSQATLQNWCVSQRGLCTVLCDNSPLNNTCTATTLDYTCLCSSNHSAPGLQYYVGSIIQNECESSYGQCVQQHPNDKAGQQNCNNTFVCGQVNASASSTSATASSTGGSSAGSTGSATKSSGSTGTSTSTSTSTSSSLAIAVGTDYGFGMLVVALIGAFGALL
ncbi:hypothetical protein MMC20_002706 [Loxospora ochrophaea]|nr:hypothetical protein [Loxospora ochrophaea]